MSPVGSKVRVLVVEDSPVARRLLVHIVNGDSGMAVIQEAADGEEAVALASRLRPDVILMDIHLPGMDGLEATRRIMHDSPTPIVLISAGFQRGDSQKTFEALASGALTVVPKPQGPGTQGFAEEVADLTITLKLMAEVKLVRRRTVRPGGSSPPASVVPLALHRRGGTRVIALAASTGGPAALATILAALPASIPVPILVVQHITPGFHHGLVAWLDSVTPLPVRLAEDGQMLHPGEVVVAPRDLHLGVARGGRVALSGESPIRGHRPSATHLFRSLTDAYGARAVGVILTGMGDDGTAGLEALKEAGGLVLAQDEATSVVYGMPREPVARGLVDHIVPIELIGPTLIQLLNGGGP